MRDITVSIDVYAKIWAVRRQGEATENEVLDRVMREYELWAPSHNAKGPVVQQLAAVG